MQACGCHRGRAITRFRERRHVRSNAPESPRRLPADSEAISPDSFAQLDREKFASNMLKVGVQTQQLLLDFVKRMANRDNAGPLDPLNISGAFLALAKAMSRRPRDRDRRPRSSCGRTGWACGKPPPGACWAARRPPWSRPRPATGASSDSEWQRERDLRFHQADPICSPPTRCRRWWPSCNGIPDARAQAHRILHQAVRRRVRADQFPADQSRSAARHHRSPMARIWSRGWTIFWPISSAAMASFPSASRPTVSCWARISPPRRARWCSATRLMELLQIRSDDG